jgi:hypothetical protein
MYNVAENSEMSVPDDSNTYPPKIANPDGENVTKKLKEVQKIRSLGISEVNTETPSSKREILPYENEDHGIHYSYIDYDHTVQHDIPNTKLDANQIIYQFSDLNDVIVRKMISFRKNSLKFTDICKKPSVNSAFIREFLDKIDFVELTKNDVISKDDFKIIDEFNEHFNWDDLCKNVKISPRFMGKYYDKIKWDSIINNITFTEGLIKQHSNKINFALLLDFEKRVLSNDFVRAHIEELNIDTEDKILRLFNNLPVNGNIFQMIGQIDENTMSGDLRGSINKQDNAYVKTYETSWKNDKKKYEEIREDLSKKVPSGIVSPWNNTEEIRK